MLGHCSAKQLVCAQQADSRGQQDVWSAVPRQGSGGVAAAAAAVITMALQSARRGFRRAARFIFRLRMLFPPINAWSTVAGETSAADISGGVVAAAQRRVVACRPLPTRPAILMVLRALCDATAAEVAPLVGRQLLHCSCRVATSIQLLALK